MNPNIVAAIVTTIYIVCVFIVFFTIDRARSQCETNLPDAAVILVAILWPILMLYFIIAHACKPKDFETLKSDHRKQRGRTIPDYTYGEQQCPHCKVINSRPLNESKTKWKCIQCGKTFTVK